MKCLNCRTDGRHFNKKICPACTSQGVTREDISYSREEITFIGTRAEVNKDAAQHIEELRKEKAVTHVQYQYTDGGPKRSNFCKMEVSWIQYEPKAGATSGSKKANKSK